MADSKNELKKGEAGLLKESTSQAENENELADAELDEVSGGKLPGKKKPPTLTLKRGKYQS